MRKKDAKSNLCRRSDKKRRELNSTEQEDYYHVENNIEKGYIIIKYEKLELEVKEEEIKEIRDLLAQQMKRLYPSPPHRSGRKERVMPK